MDSKQGNRFLWVSRITGLAYGRECEWSISWTIPPAEAPGRRPCAASKGARDLSRRNVSTSETTSHDSKTSVANQHACGLKSALRGACLVDGETRLTIVTFIIHLVSVTNFFHCVLFPEFFWSLRFDGSLRACLKKWCAGSTGDTPVPSGDSPDGTGAIVRANGHGLFAELLAAVPVGGSSRLRVGSESPAPPIFKTRSLPQVCSRKRPSP
jgi:hypothetical protein